MSALGFLTAHGAETSPAAPDLRLRGRTYAIPFDIIWTASVRLASGGLRGLVLVSADDGVGDIVAEATSRILRRVDDVEIRVRLDEDAQTRVDMHSEARLGRADLGRNRRRIVAFFRALDAAVDAAPEQILDARFVP